MKKKLNLINVLLFNFPLIISSIIISCIVTICNIQLRKYSGNIIDQIGIVSEIHYTLIGITGCIFILVIGSFINKYILKRLIGFTCKQLLDKLTYSISNCNQAWLNNQNKGDAINTFTTDVNGVGNYINRIVGIAVSDAFLFFITCILIFKINFYLAILIIISSTIPVFVINISSNLLQKKYKTFQEIFSNANKTLHDTLSNIELVKAYSIQVNSLDNYSGKLKQSNEYNRTLAKFESLGGAISILTSFLTVLVTVGYGGWLVSNSYITIGTFFTILMLTDYIIDPIMKFSNTVFITKKTKVNIERLNKYLLAPCDSLGNKELVQIDSKIVLEMRNVSFSYNENDIILNEFNLRIKKGEHIYIIGPIGSGKSSILKIIAGFLQNYKGDVYLYEQNLKECNIESLRSIISFVTQDIFLFSGTIYDNISIVKPNSTKEDIEEVCKLAGIHTEIVNMEKGYFTNIGEDGYGISGGQKQRLSLARAFLANSPIFLLDEPYSALDIKNKEHIKKTLSKIGKNKVIITVTHDTSIIDDNSRVISLESLVKG